MKKLLSFIALLTLLTLAACGGNESSTSTSDVIQSFKDAGLEIGEVSDLPNKEFGDNKRTLFILLNINCSKMKLPKIH